MIDNQLLVATYNDFIDKKEEIGEEMHNPSVLTLATRRTVRSLSFFCKTYGFLA